jgi:DNA-directed RNA polymerase specialized sigma24 family protein
VLPRLERLPGKQREALRLKFQSGLSYKEIAAVMDETVGNVGWLIHVGLKGLRGRLAAEGAEL